MLSVNSDPPPQEHAGESPPDAMAFRGLRPSNGVVEALRRSFCVQHLSGSFAIFAFHPGRIVRRYL